VPTPHGDARGATCSWRAKMSRISPDGGQVEVGGVPLGQLPPDGGPAIVDGRKAASRRADGRGCWEPERGHNGFAQARNDVVVLATLVRFRGLGHGGPRRLPSRELSTLSRALGLAHV